MSLLIRIPLAVENMNALAGYYTDGPSLMAVYGLVSQLEEDASFTVDRFGVVVEAYEARHAEGLTTGLDLLDKAKQRDGVRPSTGYRYANLRAALYLETEALDSDDQADLLRSLECSLNARRVQGGNQVEYVSADPRAPMHLVAVIVRTDLDRAAFILKHEKPLSTLYLSHHLPQTLRGPELVDAYADALTRKEMLMVCHGYILVGTVLDAAGQTQNIGEPSYTLVKAMPVHAFKKLEAADQAEALPRLLWSFDKRLHEENPNLFLLT